MSSLTDFVSFVVSLNVCRSLTDVCRSLTDFDHQDHRDTHGTVK